jgi:hypothetical protein
VLYFARKKPDTVYTVLIKTGDNIMYGILINQKEQEHPEIDLSGEQCAADLPLWQRLWQRLSGLMGW